MFVSLIIPPSPLLLDPKRNCPLGILYVAASLDQAGHEVHVADLRGIGEHDWLDHIPSADVYGISATSLEYPAATSIAKSLRRWHKESPIVLGGVHATVSDSDHLVFDRIVRGEGELVADIAFRNPCSNIRGSAPDVDRLPLPARYLLPWDSVISTHLVEEGEAATTIIGSRGCPYACAFCASPAMYGRRVRLRSPNLIAEEIGLLQAQGVHQFRFQDDLLTLHRQWLEEFTRAIAPLKVKFRANARVDSLDEDKISLLLEAGCIDIGLGVESVYQPTLDLIHKGQTVEQAKQAIAMCKRAGLSVRVFLIIGLPGDFGDLSGRMIAFLKETEPDGVDANTLIPFPGSDIYNRPLHYGMILRANYSLENLRMVAGAIPGELEEDFTFEYKEMSNQELIYHRRKVVEYVYSRNLNVDD